MSASRRCSTGWSASGGRWSTTSRASPATGARARAGSAIFRFTVIDTAGLEEAAPESLCGRMQAQTEAAIGAGRRRSVPDRCARRRDAGRSRRSPIWCASPASRPSSSPTRAKAAPAKRARSKPMRSASASRWRSRPSMAKGWPISTMRCARRCPRRPQRCRGGRRRGRADEAAEPDPRRGRRASEHRQVDADQPSARRGAAADRPRGGHHARRDRRRSRLARPAFAHPRHRGLAPPLAHRGEARKAFGRRRAQRHPFCRGGDRADRCADAVRGAGPPHRRSGRAGRPRGRHRHQQMGPDRARAGAARASLREQVDHWLPQIKGVPVVALSALTGEGLDR